MPSWRSPTGREPRQPPTDCHSNVGIAAWSSSRAASVPFIAAFGWSAVLVAARRVQYQRIAEQNPAALSAGLQQWTGFSAAEVPAHPRPGKEDRPYLQVLCHRFRQTGGHAALELRELVLIPQLASVPAQ